MITRDLLIDFVAQQVTALGQERALRTAEIERIMQVFHQALANSFMDENQIYQKLIQEGSGRDENSADRS